MKIFLSYIFVFLAVWLSAKEIYLFQTTDLHGIVHSTKEKSGSQIVLSALSAEADRQGRDKSILIDCGDLLQGSLEAATDQGAAMIRLLNMAKYDIWVPGNHDFEFGPQVLGERIKSFKGETLAANLQFPDVKPYRIFHKNGIRIAVVGMTNEHLSQWLFQPEKEGFHVSAVEAAYKKILPDLLKEKPDAIVLAIHSGLYPSKRLNDDGLFAFARRHPEISVILGGHTHEKIVCRQLGRSGVCYFQAGAHGGGYIRIKLDFDDSTKKLKNISGIYVTVPQQTKIMPQFAVRRTFHPGVCRNFPTNLSEKQLAGTFAAAILSGKPSVQGVFHGVLTKFRPKRSFLNRIHLFQLCPFENKVVLAKLTESEYKAILKEQELMKKYGMRQYFYPRGKSPWSGTPGKRILVAFNSYSAAGAGGRFPVLNEILNRPEAEARVTDQRIFDLYETYVKENFK